jgi:Uma2 family endonuclease
MLRWLDSPSPTMTTATARTRRWTHEIVDGRHFVNPAPSPYHQLVSGHLHYELMRLVAKAGLGQVFAAPIDVHLAPGTVVQPDLVVLRTRTRRIVGDKKLTGVPDLLVEILSPSNRRYDQRTKRDRYERAGVREFWLGDPDARTIEQLVLRSGGYRAPIVATASITLRVFRGVTIDLADVW